jgi:hypothetical protein
MMSSNTCANCNTISTSAQPLKLCTNYKAVGYCNRSCQKAHFKTHKKVCREQNIAEDAAARDEVANEKAAKDALAEQLAAEFLVSLSNPTIDQQQPRVMCYVDERGAAVSRTLDGVEHFQPAYTYILRYLPAMAQGERDSSQYVEFPTAMVAAMDYMTEAEKAAYHAKIRVAVVKEWEELDDDPTVAEWGEQERRKMDRFAKKCKAEHDTKCLNERT